MIEIQVYGFGAVGRIPPYVYLGVIFFFVIGSILLLWQKGMTKGLRQSALLLLAEWIILVFGIAVIFRESGADCRINLIPFSSYYDYGGNSYFMEKAVLNILNVALFIPIGFLLGCGFRSMTWKRTLIIAVMFSVFIEILQLVFRRGLCEVDDVIHNTVGCMIGYGVIKAVQRIFLKMNAIYL